MFFRNFYYFHSIELIYAQVYLALNFTLKAIVLTKSVHEVMSIFVQIFAQNCPVSIKISVENPQNL